VAATTRSTAPALRCRPLRVYRLASLARTAATVLLTRLLLAQVRELLEEAAGVVRTWRTAREDLTLAGRSAEGRVGHPEAQAEGCGAERDRTLPRPELP
jgi:hypothetical protein